LFGKQGDPPSEEGKEWETGASKDIERRNPRFTWLNQIGGEEGQREKDFNQRTSGRGKRGKGEGGIKSHWVLGTGWYLSLTKED